jgi:phage terminase large subunit GpA-like protein
MLNSTKKNKLLKKLFTKNFLFGLKTDKDYKVTEWADNFRYLSTKSSSEPGKYSSDRTPYAKEIMDCMTSDSSIQEVVLMWASQTSKSETINNCIGYYIDISPSPIMFVLPTVNMAKKYSKQRIQTMIDETPVLVKKVSKAKSRDGSNTVLSKEFIGGVIHIIGANSPSELSSFPIRVLFMDEVDRFPLDAGDEGSPLELAKKRTTSFGQKRKVLITSTPTIKHISAVEKEYIEGDQRKYFVPCPICGHKQHLIFENIKFERYAGQKKCIEDSVYYQCELCNGQIKEHNKTLMLKNGEWKTTNLECKNERKRSYHLNGLYSPLGWKAWYEIVDEFLQAKDDNNKLKTFVNTVLAETWESKGSSISYSTIRDRAEDYNLKTINMKACFLTAGIDIQDNRICVLITAWGENEECWIIDYHEILGNPAEDNVFIELDKVIRREYKHESGTTLSIRKANFDTGGHFTQRVKDFCKKYNDKYIPVKGSSHNLSTVITSKPNKDGIYFIGTSLVKEELYSRLNLPTENTDRYIHISNEFDEEFFKMLTSEKMLTRTNKGITQNEWVKTYARNEVLDCLVYAYACAYHLGIKRMNYEEVYELNIGKKLSELQPKENQEEKPINLKDNFQKLIRQNNKKGFSKNWK